jgi:hypothetical protein
LLSAWIWRRRSLKNINIEQDIPRHELIL